MFEVTQGEGSVKTMFNKEPEEIWPGKLEKRRQRRERAFWVFVWATAYVIATLIGLWILRS